MRLHETAAYMQGFFSEHQIRGVCETHHEQDSAVCDTVKYLVHIRAGLKLHRTAL